MSTMTPPMTVTRPVERPVPGEAPEQKIIPPVSEERDELDHLPEGALVLLAQLQPPSEHAQKLSLAALRAAQSDGLKRAGTAVEQATQAPLKRSGVQVPGQAREPERIAVSVPASLSTATADPKPAQAAITQAAVPTRAADPAVFASAAGAIPAAPMQVPGQAPILASVMAPSVQLAAAPPAPVADGMTAASLPAEGDGEASVRSDSSPFPASVPLPQGDRSSREPLPAKSTTPAQTAPGSMLGSEAVSGQGERHYLQVPFRKGDAAGLITVSKAAGGSPEPLLLSPSTASVFNCLSDNLAQAVSPRWRLADQGHEQGHGQGRGHHDEQTDEEPRQPSRGKREQGREA